MLLICVWIILFTLILGYKFVIYKRDLLNVSIIIHRKYLGIIRVRRNCASFSHIHDGPHHKFNEQTTPWMWKKEISFSILRKYLRITHYSHERKLIWLPIILHNCLFTIWGKDPLYLLSLILAKDPGISLSN